MKQYIKIDESKIGVIETIPEKILAKVEYDYDFLVQQKERIIQQRDSEIELRNQELSQVEELITQADALGIKPKNKEEIKE